MARTQTFHRREERKVRADLPVPQDLGARLTMPRRTNRTAARTIAAGDRFWDKRKVARKARREALASHEARVAHPLPHRLSRKQKEWVAAHRPEWAWEGSTEALKAPADVRPEQLDDLIRVTHLPYMQRALLKVQDLAREQAEYVTARAPQTMRIVLVDPCEGSARVIRTPA